MLQLIVECSVQRFDKELLILYTGSVKYSNFQFTFANYEVITENTVYRLSECLYFAGNSNVGRGKEFDGSSVAGFLLGEVGKTHSVATGNFRQERTV